MENNMPSLEVVSLKIHIIENLRKGICSFVKFSECKTVELERVILCVEKSVKFFFWYILIKEALKLILPRALKLLRRQRLFEN